MQDDTHTPPLPAPVPLPPPALPAAGLPAPTVVGRVVSSRYRSPRPLSIALQIAAAIDVVVSALVLAFAILALPQLKRPEWGSDRAIDDFWSKALAVTLVNQATGLLMFGLLIALTRRLYRNLPSLTPGRPQRFAAGWAVGAWFLPILNLIRPKQIIDEIWYAPGRPALADGDRRDSSSAWLQVWWGLRVLMFVFGVRLRSQPDEVGLEGLDAWIAMVVLDTSIGIAFALLTMWVGHELTRRDQARAGTEYGHRRAPHVGMLATSGLGALALVIGLTTLAPRRSSEAERTTPVEATTPPARASAPPTSPMTTPDDPDSPATTDPVRSGQTISVADIAEGDCLDFPAGFGDAMPGDDVVVSDVELRSCDTPHDAEVIVITQSAAGPGAEYPGADAVLSEALEICSRRFESLVGGSDGEPELDVLALAPTYGWRFGDREIDCLVVRLDGRKLDSTVVGSPLHCPSSGLASDDDVDPSCNHLVDDSTGW